MSTSKVIHLATGSSTVRCGFPMRDGSQGWGADAPGWDLGDVSVNAGDVTCPDCRPRLRTNPERTP